MNSIMVFTACKMNFNKSSKTTALWDAIGSIIIGGLVICAWFRVDKPIQYIYYPSELPWSSDDQSTGENWDVRRLEGLEGCVITWCLTILLVLCAWRVISAAILILAARTRSLCLLQYWIGYKCLVLMMSTFVLVSAFTSTSCIPSAVASFVVDLGTGYFVTVLIPELAIISKGSVRIGNRDVVII